MSEDVCRFESTYIGESSYSEFTFFLFSAISMVMDKARFGFFVLRTFTAQFFFEAEVIHRNV